MKHQLDFQVCFTLTCRNPDGSLAWRDAFTNGITTEGLNHILETEFRGGTPLTTWYLGLISGATTPSLAAADTMSSHAGWTESTAYSQSTRPAWTPDAASGGVLTNGTARSFTCNATGTMVQGLFLTSVSTKGGTTGTLWATGMEATAKTLVNGQVLSATYRITATAG